MPPITPGPDQPLSLKIAADPRVGPTDYADDACYAITTTAGPLGLLTSLGGRAEGVMLDLLWRRPGELAYALDEYAAPLMLTAFGPGFATLSAQPFADVTARVDMFMYSSHAVLCRVTASGPGPIDLTFGLRAQLAPGLAPVQPATPLMLAGACHGALMLAPGADLRLVLLTSTPGDTAAEVLPARRGWTAWRQSPLEPPAGGQAQVWGALLTPRRTNDVTALASTILGADLEALLAHHIALAEAIPAIETGDPAWDAAIACAYRLHARCYLGATTHLPHPSFVFARIPERGYSRAGDGSDHAWQWNGQVATEAYVSCPAVAPFAPELAMGVIRNYLAVQEENGRIDWKPGLGGQRAGLDCIPLLAPICRAIYAYTGDDAFLREVYPGLVRHLQRWLSPANDRDGDGLPEWSSTIQSAFDDHPSFVTWQPWGQGADIRMAECPDLGAYLYREAADLAWMAQHIDADPAALQAIAGQLRAHVEQLWDHNAAIYRYRDRDTHLTHPGGLVVDLAPQPQADPAPGSPDRPPFLPDLPQIRSAQGERTAPQPRRVVVRVTGPEWPEVAITLRGQDQAGQPVIETLRRAQFSWWERAIACATTRAVFTRIDAVHIGTPPARNRPAMPHDAASQPLFVVCDQTLRHDVQISWVDYTREDQTLLLPLWAGIPDRERAAALVRTMTDPARFWRPYGIPNCSAQDPAYQSSNHGGSGGTWMMWNSMLGEGLCDYGYFAEAWELFGRIMAAIVGRLREEQSFREAYDNDTGAGIGTPDYLWGAVPLHFLARLIGTQVMVDGSVRLRPADVGARSVTLRARGVTIRRQGATATVTWPDGRTITVVPAQEIHLQHG